MLILRIQNCNNIKSLCVTGMSALQVEHILHYVLNRQHNTINSTIVDIENAIIA